LLHKLNTPQ